MQTSGNKENTMRQVFLQKGKIRIEEVDPPLVNDHHILVQISYSFISSGTEKATIDASGKSLIERYVHSASAHTFKVFGALKEHGFASTIALAKEKMGKLMPLGYSCAGQIVWVGSKVTKFCVGDYVACAGSLYANHADIVSVPQNLATKVKNPELLKYASLTAIGSIALQAIRRAKLQLGETVCIVGMGLIGQLIAQLAKHAGCRVIGIDIQQQRLDLASKLGTDTCLNPLSTDIVKELEYATNHYGVDTTILAASAQTGELLQQAMTITRRKGRVVLVGDIKIDFDRDPFYSKEIDLLISCSYGPGRYDQRYEEQNLDYPYAYVRWTENRNMAYFIELLEKQAITIAPLISHEFSIQKAAQAYQTFQKEKALGVIISYNESQQQTAWNPYTHPSLSKHYYDGIFKPYTYPRGTINTAIVGAGGFAKIKIIPSFFSIKGVHIHSIIDTDTSNALTLARMYKAQRISNDYHKILGDDDINVAIIATPHAFHAEQAMDCLSAGKAVFVEKPAAISFEQYKKLTSFLESNKNALFCVDFNRSYAPFIKSIKSVVDHRTNPLMITYRMNVGYLPQNHWIQSDENRGRIVGEVCHVFDLFCSLTNAKPTSIAVSPVNPNTQDMPLTDNISAIVTMSDGSCCTLIYTATGNSAAGKEHMEIFFDGKTIIMSDFIDLKGYGLARSFNQHVKRQDKGHEQLYKEFIKTVSQPGYPLPIPIKQILTATELSLIADKLARAGGGFEYIGD